MTVTDDAAQLSPALDDVPGWFSRTDQQLFEWFLTHPHASGDLLEMGVYVGKSAILLGQHLRPGESLTVCDLFDSPAPDAANGAEVSEYHPLATREVFEKNYLSFHDELPRVLEAPTSVLAEEVAADSCRFVHIDASHLYHHVTEDIGTARNVLLPQGVVVLDDFRAPHTPGVALATWEAVVRRDLNPICVSEGKLYGTWGDPRPAQKDILESFQSAENFDISVEMLARHQVIKFQSRTA
ncbi:MULTISPECIES: class I SAM-dependent methyltransferase [unclassified Streptomyces]|uniref:class I SAM-dependent methyltransferase n=1 Tax=unclassified Streptomyces TaxID=2593676 RepID=UPI002DD8AB31|nr:MULTISPECIES: class I SAM-dependent methyltransferase [unclassified Streptomyces]WSA95192.1 class I SAM-dependent methyltransferase [Streptomyces sp. NBC_01795]WSB79611.1 class I SAM-dependent methyltransferase [Streptomyces sp. NBC_01775]WSS12186.1 class I SAM-dependent methyltransferase [Streptomyces sp. NBC_01186]WSS40898.1 class I SAM-dependent methyltransferase [Streptomyces sp. NBC_01187]